MSTQSTETNSAPSSTRPSAAESLLSISLVMFFMIACGFMAGLSYRSAMDAWAQIDQAGQDWGTVPPPENFAAMMFIFTGAFSALSVALLAVLVWVVKDAFS